jgi:hypothetical protein
MIMSRLSPSMHCGQTTAQNEKNKKSCRSSHQMTLDLTKREQSRKNLNFEGCVTYGMAVVPYVRKCEPQTAGSMHEIH